MLLRKPTTCFSFLVLLCAGADAQSQRPAPFSAWAPQPAKPAPFTRPNALHKKLTDILARHAGKSDWTETEVLTRDYIGQYISMAPGQKTKTQFWADDRIFWVVEQGSIRFTIEGQQPFVAIKGFLVQVPYRVPYSMESVGDQPSLRFEVRASYETPSYPLTETPPRTPGMTFIKADYTGKGKYD